MTRAIFDERERMQMKNQTGLFREKTQFVTGMETSLVKNV